VSAGPRPGRAAQVAQHPGSRVHRPGRAQPAERVVRGARLLLGQFGLVGGERASEREPRLADVERHREPAELRERAASGLGGVRGAASRQMQQRRGELGSGRRQGDPGLTRDMGELSCRVRRPIHVP
jgi:hypothetical protein